MDCVEHAPRIPSDWNITWGRVTIAGSLNDSGLTVNECARDSGLKSRSANNTGSMRFVSAIHDYGRWLNQSPFRPRAEVSFPCTRQFSECNGKKASASRETIKFPSSKTKCLNCRCTLFEHWFICIQSNYVNILSVHIFKFTAKIVEALGDPIAHNGDIFPFSEIMCIHGHVYFTGQEKWGSHSPYHPGNV